MEQAYCFNCGNPTTATAAESVHWPAGPVCQLCQVQNSPAYHSTRTKRRRAAVRRSLSC